MRVFKYMKGYAGVAFLIALLLLVQAYCDLSLPEYTSDIIDTGIQNKGVESVLPEKIKNYWLFALSLIFFGWLQPQYIWVIAFSIVINYLSAFLIDRFRKRKKLILVIVIILNLLVLFFYALTYVPFISPSSAFAILFSPFKPNTASGMWFSRHMIDAVRSITPRRLSTTS